MIVSEPQPEAFGNVVAFAATAISGLDRARRLLMEKVLFDAGATAIPSTYECATWIGWAQIRSAAERIRRERVTMAADPNPLDQLEFALSEAASISTDDDPPVLMLGSVAVTRDPRSGVGA